MGLEQKCIIFSLFEIYALPAGIFICLFVYTFDGEWMFYYLIFRIALWLTSFPKEEEKSLVKLSKNR